MVPSNDVLSLIRVLMTKAMLGKVLLWCHRDNGLRDVLLPLPSQCARVNEIVFVSLLYLLFSFWNVGCTVIVLLLLVFYIGCIVHLPSVSFLLGLVLFYGSTIILFFNMLKMLRTQWSIFSFLCSVHTFFNNNHHHNNKTIKNMELRRTWKLRLGSGWSKNWKV